MIKFQDGRYFIGVWFFGVPKEMDWMGAIWRDSETDNWHIQYRFRYYEDDKAFDSADRKNWYEGEASPETSEIELESKLTGVMSVMAAVKGSKLEYVEMKSADAKANIEKFQGAPFVHVKKMTTDEALAAGYINPLDQTDGKGVA